MAVDDDAGTSEARETLRPNLAVLAGGSAAIALLGATTLPWPDAAASILLGILMISGADIDARTFLLPNIVTGGGVMSGLAVASALDPSGRWPGLVTATGGALLVGAALWAARLIYAWWRGREGIGLGDVKLAAAVGAWLPLEAVPYCFALATGAALIAVVLARWRGEPIERTARVPFGAFLCPALWIVDYATRLLGW